MKDTDIICCLDTENNQSENGNINENTSRNTNRNIKLKKALITRLNRVEGQVRGIRGMIEKDCYCDDVLNQIAAASAALNGISKLLLENHIRNCVVQKIKDDESGIVEELITTIDKILKK